MTEINHEGTMTAAKARASVEPILRNRKKADLIIKKLGSPSTLEAASAAGGQPIRHVDTVLFSSPGIPNLGQEPKVIGYSFNKELSGKPASVPVPGQWRRFCHKGGKYQRQAQPRRRYRTTTLHTGTTTKIADQLSDRRGAEKAGVDQRQPKQLLLRMTGRPEGILLTPCSRRLRTFLRV